MRTSSRVRPMLALAATLGLAAATALNAHGALGAQDIGEPIFPTTSPTAFPVGRP